jgi:peptidoglycan/LPS O-acetylase OafA/YrhL
VEKNGLVGVAPMMISINWSIAIEEQFYLFWPLLFLLSGARRFWIVIISVMIMSWYFREFVLHGPELYYHTLAVISDLAIGSLMAYLSFYNGAFVNRIKNLHPAIHTIAYAAGFYLLMYNVFSNAALQRIAASLFFTFVIMEQNFSLRSLYKFRNNSVLTSLGKYTYSFYLVHPIGIQVSILTFRFLNWQIENGIYYAVAYATIAFFVTMFLAHISYRYLERFFLGLKAKFYYSAAN